MLSKYILRALILLETVHNLLSIRYLDVTKYRCWPHSLSKKIEKVVTKLLGLINSKPYWIVWYNLPHHTASCVHFYSSLQTSQPLILSRTARVRSCAHCEVIFVHKTKIKWLDIQDEALQATETKVCHGLPQLETCVHLSNKFASTSGSCEQALPKIVETKYKYLDVYNWWIQEMGAAVRYELLLRRASRVCSKNIINIVKKFVLGAQVCIIKWK